MNWWKYSDWRIFFWAIAHSDIRECEIVFIPGHISAGRCYCSEPEFKISIRLPFLILVVPREIREHFWDKNLDALDDIPF